MNFLTTEQQKALSLKEFREALNLPAGEGRKEAIMHNMLETFLLDNKYCSLCIHCLVATLLPDAGALPLASLPNAYLTRLETIIENNENTDEKTLDIDTHLLILGMTITRKKWQAADVFLSHLFTVDLSMSQIYWCCVNAGVRCYHDGMWEFAETYAVRVGAYYEHPGFQQLLLPLEEDEQQQIRIFRIMMAWVAAMASAKQERWDDAVSLSKSLLIALYGAGCSPEFEMYALLLFDDCYLHAKGQYHSASSIKLLREYFGVPKTDTDTKPETLWSWVANPKEWVSPFYMTSHTKTL